jgi:hypothetical protein
VRAVTEAGEGSPHGAARVSRQTSEQRNRLAAMGVLGPFL